MPLSEGARLVVLRDAANEHDRRLLVPKAGTPTFVTPPLPLDPFDQVGLGEFTAWGNEGSRPTRSLASARNVHDP